MSKNNDLGCSGYLEQASQARNTPPAGPADRENLAAFARRLGVNRSTVTRAAQSGRLVLADDGRVCIAASLARWHATRGGRDDVAARHAAARGFELPPGAVASLATPATSPETGPRSPEQPGDEGEAPAAGTRAFWEAEKVRWQNAELLLALDLDSGVRIPRQALQHEAQGLGATLRATVERVIDQTAPRLVAAATADDRHRLLAGELAAARRTLLREFGAAARRLRPAGAGLRLSTAPDTQEATP